MIDITERKQTEQTLKDTEERLRLAMESAPIGTWDLNLISWTYRWDRRCKAMFGLPPDAEVSHEDFLVMIHPDDRGGVIAAFERSTHSSGDGSFDTECRVVRSDGREVGIRAMGRVFLRNATGSAGRSGLSASCSIVRKTSACKSNSNVGAANCNRP